MIIYSHDVHLQKIKNLNKSFNEIITDNIYYIYGLKQTCVSHISISTGSPHYPLVEELKVLLAKNNIILNYTSTRYSSLCKCRNYKYKCACKNKEETTINDYRYDFHIGIRRDIRNNNKYTAALIKTIVCFLEKKLKLSNFQIPAPNVKPVVVKPSIWNDKLQELQRQLETQRNQCVIWSNPYETPYETFPAHQIVVHPYQTLQAPTSAPAAVNIDI